MAHFSKCTGPRQQHLISCRIAGDLAIKPTKRGEEQSLRYKQREKEALPPPDDCIIILLHRSRTSDGDRRRICDNIHPRLFQILERVTIATRCRQHSVFTQYPIA